MRVLHLNTGNENGGGMHHILSLLSQFNDGEVILGLFEHGEMMEQALQKGIPVVLFEQQNQKDLTIIFEVIRYLKEFEIDFVHTHGPRATFLAALMKTFIKQPILTTIHSNPNDDFSGQGIKGKMFYKLYKWAFKSVDHFLVVSDEFSTVMKNDFQIEEHQISTIWNGIVFEPDQINRLNREDLGFSNHDLLIVMIARLEPVKRHDLAIEAFEHLSQHQPNAQLLLIGEGTQKDYINHLIKQKGLQNKIHLLGYREDAQNVLELADVCLLTSKSESFPIVLLEAARAKVPIVTTNVGDVKQLIPNEDYGTVVNRVTPETLSQAIYNTIQKETSQQTERLYQHAKNHYSLQHFYTRVRQIYENLNNEQIQCKEFVKKYQ
ncbi:glycosyltransferase family 4 protein [Aquisalibacillus elongatus]|uniref:Glycosyltransferase involved in cell wall biosynthesis n=1 Tax=Aquisalibacillus elongatus TaxID=485577 RepID=A0A3N5C791_9BACI|nr:glycosyltransferase family 4 protein [Aquisalibacillus elongatus]RPF54195.1 hypothetical protein EDC24_1388 [Aquisalibacillus elongatus]